MSGAEEGEVVAGEGEGERTEEGGGVGAFPVVEIKGGAEREKRRGENIRER